MKPVVLFFLLLQWIAVTHAGIYRWVDADGKVHFSDKNPAGQSTQKIPSAPSSAEANQKVELNQSSDNGRWVAEQAQAESRLKQFRQWLLKGEYKRLNEGLQQLAALREKDILHERQEVWIYKSLAGADARFDQPIQSWIHHSPAHYQPYLVRLNALLEKAFKARGSQVIGETTAEQLAAMNALVEQAMPDINRVLNRNPRALAAYSSGIWIYKLAGKERSAEALYRQGLDYVPASEHLYQSYIRTLRPRWGGSHEGMQSVAIQAKRSAKLNPRLLDVEAEITADVMKSLVQTNRYRDVIRLLSNDESSPLLQRYLGKAHYHLEDYEQSIQWLQRSRQGNPFATESHYQLARAQYKKKDYYPAAQALSHVVLSEPWNTRYQAKAARVAESMLYDLRMNISLYTQEQQLGRVELADHLSGNDPDARLQLAFYYWDVKQPKKSEAEFEHLLQVAPDNLRVHRQYDRFLVVHGRQWQKIVAFWQRYLQRNPDDSVAWLEIGGTYLHMKKFDKAKEAWLKSAALGNVEAQQNYDSIRHL